MKRFLVLILLLFASLGSTSEYKPIILSVTHDHDPYIAQPAEIIRNFRAFTVSFDGPDDGVYLRVPQWVAYEVKKAPKDLPASPDRPSKWMTDKPLNAKGIAPTDDSYYFSDEYREAYPNGEYDYDRGHMCMKVVAWREGANADWNTHTVLNACPQKDYFNRGIWLDLEKKVLDWADAYGRVWVICGPTFRPGMPIKWLSHASLLPEIDNNNMYGGFLDPTNASRSDELPVAIPDGFFKIIYRENAFTLDQNEDMGYDVSVMEQVDAPSPPYVMAFHFPHKPEIQKIDGEFPYKDYLVTVDYLESITGLDFFTLIEDEREEWLEKELPTLWKFDLQ